MIAPEYDIISQISKMALFEKAFNGRYSWLTRTYNKKVAIRGGSRTAATFKMERFVIIVNGFQPLAIITKRSILDVAAVLDPLLAIILLKTATAYALVLNYYQD